MEEFTLRRVPVRPKTFNWDELQVLRTKDIVRYVGSIHPEWSWKVCKEVVGAVFDCISVAIGEGMPIEIYGVMRGEVSFTKAAKYRRGDRVLEVKSQRYYHLRTALGRKSGQEIQEEMPSIPDYE